MVLTPEETCRLGPMAGAFRAQARRRVAGRVPLALGIFVGCYLLSAAFEWRQYPERRAAMAAAAIVFSVESAVAAWLVRRRPDLSVVAMVVTVNLASAVIVVYHAAVGALAEPCLLVLTGLLTTVVVILPWGWRAQALACSGAAVGFALTLLRSPGPAGAGFGITPSGAPGALLTFLAVVIGMSVFGAELIERYLRSDFRLTETLREREASLARARDAAEAANRVKSDFLASMSHEIRTPMNVIFGMTDMALDSNLGKEQREYVQRTRAAAGTLLVLVNDILDFSRIEAGRVRLEPREFGLREWLGRTLEPFAYLAREKGLDLSWEIPADVAERRVGDPDRLAQVVVNVVSNAVKFTERGGVGLAVAPVALSNGGPERLHFVVSDSGVGIAPEDRSAIFEAFVQGRDGEARDRGGTGLGLAICSRLVQLMGGQIWVESEVGVGSRFHFTALLAAAGASPLADGADARANGREAG